MKALLDVVSRKAVKILVNLYCSVYHIDLYG